jgi:iron uptake system EfeUOB component EfeO/EfeM
VLGGAICLLNHEGGIMLNGFRVITSGVVLGAILLSGCSNSAESDEAQQEKSPVMNENPDSNTGEAQNAEVIKKGVGDVIQSIKGLETELSAEADPERIQEMGKEMSSVWDSIEKQVEDEYPDWYERIEKNLYPLIGEAGNPEKDLEKIKRLSEATKEDLQLFLEEVN